MQPIVVLTFSYFNISNTPRNPFEPYGFPKTPEPAASLSCC
jgi:hypothetical protein